MAHNFFIGGLGFNKVVNDEHPYERATAPFRKEQFDTSAKVGDQSLAGWWTRGQLSFHKGAGVEYYEVLDGEEVLNRYNDSLNLDTLSTPGEVVLEDEVGTWLTASANIYQAVEGTGQKVWFLIDPGTVNAKVYSVSYSDASDLTQRTIAGTGYPERICTSPGGDLFIATSTGNIERHPLGFASGSVVYTHSQQWAGLWYAKDRLWAVDETGALYVLTPNPSTPPVAVSGTPPMTFSDDPGTGWTYLSFASSPAHVYLSDQSNVIYRIALVADGSVPTLAAPVVAAELPSGDDVTALVYHMGHLVICAGDDVRVAAIESDGSLVYGPKLCDGRWGGMTRGTVVRVTTTTGTVNEIDLSSPIDGLTFPYRSIYDVASPGTGSTGAVHINGAYFAMWSGSTLYTNLTPNVYKSAQGDLTTGYHRFGTLDDKHFHEVIVRASGSGTIDVYKVLIDGTATLLGTMNAADASATFAVNEGPAERIALKFVLKRDAGSKWYGPTLLGYQLKALPSPKRQRLIRVPLMMFDIERGATGRATGREKDAWVRYSALEALEESDALIDFEDKDTGETGIAYIESVELIQRNGSKGRSASNGFGGIVSVTLRKVD